jgi:hypothetical protein
MIQKLNVIEEDFNMRAVYLIALIENFCRINQLDISKIYKKMANIYLNTYGVNIDMEMHEAGYCDMPIYLEKVGIVERYVEILNGLEKMIKNNWDLELDKL